MKKLEEKTLSSEQKYEGCIIKVRLDSVELQDGSKHHREVVEHPGGVVIIPILDAEKVILIKQWRHPIAQELIELPAGKLNLGEDPLLAATRELQEETGYIAETIEDLGFVYTTPGFCNEKLFFYKATNLTYFETDFDHGEIIEPYIISINQAFSMIKSGKINDAKTIIGLNYIK